MRTFALLGLILSAFVGAGQSTVSGTDSCFQGYRKSLRGGGFNYHAPQPDVTTSLLIRAVDSSACIEWETEILPSVITDTAIRFIWMFGIDANPRPCKWRLFLNGRYLLSFHNPVLPDKAPWKAVGSAGSYLDFLPTLLDRYDDPMGYAVLVVPASLLEPGKPQVIRISGESAGEQTWYMTFESRVRESLSVVQEPSVIRKNGLNYRSVLFRFVHLGKPGNAEIRIGPEHSAAFFMEFGFNSIRILLPDSGDTVLLTAQIRIGNGEPVAVTVTSKPVKPWTIYLVQHTHTDIGYTRPQTEILPEHLRYLDYALDFCDQTDSLPEGTRFTWTCETAWAVREYLNTRPQEQIGRLKERISEGRIEISGMFLNSSDLTDEASAAVSLQPVRLIREHGIPVRSAMQDDINGIPWCYADLLPSAGIRNLIIAQNTHRALKPFSKPTAFWWESPAGNRVLAWRPEHYMWGNQLGILTNIETFARNLFVHLGQIEANGYPFNEYSIQFSGYLTDNSPPSVKACGLVKAWNETYLWPKLRLATVSEFLDVIRDQHSGDLEVYRKAWPDWWMDGFGSAPIETAFAREAHADNIANRTLLSIPVILGVNIPPGIRELQAQVDDALAFYDEHTFGAAESISEPLAANSIVQKGEKLSYVWEAVKKNRLLREEIMGLIQDFFPGSPVPSITVFNPLGWSRSGTVRVYIDHQILPREKSVRFLLEDGTAVPAQPLSSREDGTYWVFWVPEVPPVGFRTLQIVTGDSPPDRIRKHPFYGTLENGWYRIETDSACTHIVSILDKQIGKNMVSGTGKYTVAEFIRERLGSNRAQLEHLRLEEFTRTGLERLTCSQVTEGPVWTSVTLSGFAPGCAEGPVNCEIRLYKPEKKVEFFFSMKKLPVTAPEAVYISFPFELPGSRFVAEVAGGVIVPGVDQLDGSSADWLGIQNFVSLRNDSAQIIFVSPEIPLVHPGDINLGRFSRRVNPAAPSIYSWVLNNYWTTNFLASEEGELTWKYQLTSSSDPSNLFATKFGWGNRIPLLTRVFPARPSRNTGMPQFFSGAGLEPVLLVGMVPSTDGKGIILHLREADGKPAWISVADLLSASGASRVVEVNVLEENAVAPAQEKQNTDQSGEFVEMKCFETKFLKLIYRED